MNKKTIINDPAIYVRSRESGSRTDYYYNRKGCDNEDRGHLVIEDGEVLFNRQAPALSILVSGSSLLLNISGSKFILI